MPRAHVQWSRSSGAGLNSVLLPEQGRLLIGRRKTASIWIDGDGAVSREHAELCCVDGIWLLEDLGSRSGTYLLRDGARHRLAGRQPLRHGDRIGVGRTIVRFHCPPDLAAEIATDFAAPDVIALTPREIQLLDVLCADELSGRGGWPDNDTLARLLNISEHTVRSHLKSVYRKFNLDLVPDSQRKARLVRRAIDEGWATDER